MFGHKFLTKAPNGGYLGPFGPLLETPAGTKSALNLAAQIGELPLPPKVREVVILSIGSVWKAPYEIYAHSRVARSQGLTLSQIKAIVSGQKPEGSDKLAEEEELAMEMSLKLARGQGKLDDEMWNKAEKAFGKQGALGIVHYTAYYAFTCILLNGTDSGLPDGETLLPDDEDA